MTTCGATPTRNALGTPGGAGRADAQRIVRDATPADYEALKAMHARSGIDYAFPDLNDPLFFVKKVRVVDERINSALILKLCAETFLLLDEGTPQDKMTAMRELQAEVLHAAAARGLSEIHASVPSIGFDKRLTQLGWEKDRPGWNLWSRQTECR
jgi:hypothetical protein